MSFVVTVSFRPTDDNAAGVGFRTHGHAETAFLNKRIAQYFATDKPHRRLVGVGVLGQSEFPMQVVETLHVEVFVKLERRQRFFDNFVQLGAPQQFVQGCNLRHAVAIQVVGNTLRLGMLGG